VIFVVFFSTDLLAHSFLSVIWTDLRDIQPAYTDTSVTICCSVIPAEFIHHRIRNSKFWSVLA